MKKTGLFLFCLMLAGCANTSQTPPESLVTPSPAQANTVEPQQISPQMNDVSTGSKSLTANETCAKELAALQTYNPRSWDRYSQEMAELTSKSSQFLSVRQDLNPRISQLVMDVYDSRMQTLCYKIEGALGQAMIEQATRLAN